MQNLKFYGLLHMAENEYSAVNAKVKNFSEQLNLYLSNAALLNKSLASQNLEFTLLTNDKKHLLKSLKNFSEKINIEEIEIITTVPKGTKFYSAHFKVDAFKHISKSDCNYAVFTDLDVVCLHPVPFALENAIQAGAPLAYDITDQMSPLIGHKTVIETFENIGEMPSDGRWFGGEFMGGNPSFFGRLASEINLVLPKYFEWVKSQSDLRIVGDEVYTSVALGRMKSKGIHVLDAGSFNIVGRFWSSTPLHYQKKFAYFEESFLLHLPANKNFLANYLLLNNDFSSEQLISKFRKWMFIKKVKSCHMYIIFFLFSMKTKIFNFKILKNFSSYIRKARS